MVRAIFFKKLEKIWAVTEVVAIFLLFLDCSADLDILYSMSVSDNVKFHNLMFLVSKTPGRHLIPNSSQNFHLFSIKMCSLRSILIQFSPIKSYFQCTSS